MRLASLPSALLGRLFGRGTGGTDHRARASLERARAEHREAHLDGDAERFVATFADDFCEVRAGEVTHPTREAALERFKDYFDRVEFEAWDDLVKPVVQLAADGSLAAVVVRKRVALRPRDAGDDAPVTETVFAWLETWARDDDRWKLTALASTARPEP